MTQTHNDDEEIVTSSIPSFTEFNPDYIPYQRQVIRFINKEYDFSLGILEILLSGSVGSAKSILAAHLVVAHCLKYPGAQVLFGRRSLPDLKETIFQTTVDHLEGSKGLVENKHYWIKYNTAKIHFCNGSRILSRSWADKKYKKFRSLTLSMAVIEELTENDDKDSEAYREISLRVGRLPHVPQSLMISCTNPDGPDHWVYKRFIARKHKRRKVFYSRTDQNPFLPKSYIEGIKEDLDPKMVRRMVFGEWLHITGETVYYQYSPENFIDKTYKVKPHLPIWVVFDFNIGIGKPLSSAVMQFDDDGTLHIFGEAVVEGLRTAQNCETLAEKGYLSHPNPYIVSGDANGKNRDTRNNRSDYDIIKHFFGTYKENDIDFDMKVPLSNPPIKKRHNTVNAYCLNANNKRRLFVYKEAPTADEGLRLTKLKDGSYIEDDTKPYQHITTAIGYGIMRYEVEKRKTKQGTRNI